MTEENELVRLEGFVASLLEKFNALQAENADLTECLGRREETIVNLQDDLASMKDARGEVSSRVSSLIGQIEDWEVSSNVSVGESDGENSDENDSEGESSESGVQGDLFTGDDEKEQY
jgi:chromosome segregation ATPase